MTQSGATPKVIGRYAISRELGRGTMGVVYEGRDEALGRMVAIKTFNMTHLIAPSDQKGYEVRFMAEARIAATLQHPHIVAVHDVGRDEETGLLFMALEHVKGETLADRLEKGPLPWKDACAFLAKAARALAEAHAQGIVHRDIKPANLMISAKGEPKVMDFGIAKAGASQLTVAGQVFGTPAYMSPEQATGEDVDARSDLFSLGAMLYEMVSGYRPFEGPTMASTLTKVLRDQPASLSQASRGLPPGLDAIVKKALQKPRSQRYPTGVAFAEDLEALVAGRRLPHAADQSPLDTVDLRGPSPTSTLFDPRSQGREAPESSHPGSRRPRFTRGAGPEDEGAAEDPGSTRRVALGVVAGAAIGVAGLFFALRGGSAPAPAPTPAAAPSPASTAPVSVATPSPAPTSRAISIVPRGEPGGPTRILFELKHTLASGALRIFVDGRVVVAERVVGLPLRTLSGELAGYEGTFRMAIRVEPGTRAIEVELRSGATELRERIGGIFPAGASPRLVARAGAQLELSFEE